MPAPSPGLTPRNRLAVALLLVSTFVVILNETIMGVALPRLMSDLDIDAATAQWLTTGFMLTMAVVIPVSGFIIRRSRTRTVFLISMGLFSLGTAIAAVAPGFAVLLIGRIVQAGGTALMLPLLMTTVMTVTPAATRGRTMGTISVVISVAPALGPTISGLILAVLDWRWMFGLVLPIALVALVLGALRMPDVTEPEHAAVDWLSVPLSALGFGGLVFGLSSLGTGAGVSTVAALAVGAGALSLFAARQVWLARRDDALLDLRVFRVPTFAMGVALMALAMVTMFGVIILLPLYTQDVLGVDVLTTGLVLLPGGLLMGLLAPAVGRVYDRRGPRVLLVPGTIAVSLAMWALTMLPTSGALGFLLAAHITLSLGFALVFTPLFTAALGSLPAHQYSYGSAAIGTAQQVAGAAGTSLFVAVLTVTATNRTADGLGQVAATAAGLHAAFQVGALISLVAVVGAFWLRPAPATDPVGTGSAEAPDVVEVRGSHAG
ncbi:MAG: DHA2 family efflux MFS transporter permease subunit [Actinobacteria bacterium]|nr:DHA2 family efflux MFS transporter permease subunit [Actinomycetota bacterium]